MRITPKRLDTRRPSRGHRSSERPVRGRHSQHPARAKGAGGEWRTATHDFNKFWEMMRQRPGNTRPPLTEALLDILYRQQDRDEFLYAHRWTEGDVLMWDNIGTTHNAIADYGDHPRYMRRVQVLGDWDYGSMVA